MLLFLGNLKGDSGGWIHASIWGSLEEPPDLGHCGHLESEPVDRRSLSLSLSLYLPPSACRFAFPKANKSLKLSADSPALVHSAPPCSSPNPICSLTEISMVYHCWSSFLSLLITNMTLKLPIQPMHILH